MLVQQFQRRPDAVGQRRGAATQQDGHHEQVDLVHQAGADRVRGEARAADVEVARR